MGIVLVHEGDVEEHILLLAHHPLQTGVDDHRDLMRERRVIGHAIGDHGGQDVAVTILVLQTLAIERGSACRATQQETACTHVSRSPGQVADALQTEHGVVDVERDHDPVVGGIAGRSRNPGTHATGLVDPLLKNLALDVLAVVHHLIAVHRLVLLGLDGIDTDLTEQTLHTEGPRLVNEDGHHPGTKFLVAQQLRQTTHIRLGRGNLATFGCRLQRRLEHFERRHRELLVRACPTIGQIATQRLSALMEILHLGCVLGRLVKRNVMQMGILDGDAETVAELVHRHVIELLGLVRRIAPLGDLAHAVTLDGLDENDGRLALVTRG